MGRGLSQQQRDILDILPPHSEDLDQRLDVSGTPSAREVIGLLGLTYTPSNRASVSRALSRLKQRGLARSVWGYKAGLQHVGYTRTVPAEQD